MSKNGVYGVCDCICRLKAEKDAAKKEARKDASARAAAAKLLKHVQALGAVAESGGGGGVVVVVDVVLGVGIPALETPFLSWPSSG